MTRCGNPTTSLHQLVDQGSETRHFVITRTGDGCNHHHFQFPPPTPYVTCATPLSTEYAALSRDRHASLHLRESRCQRPAFPSPPPIARWNILTACSVLPDPCVPKTNVQSAFRSTVFPKILSERYVHGITDGKQFPRCFGSPPPASLEGAAA